MRKNTFLLAMVALFTFVFAANAQTTQKIGYVDAAYIVPQLPEAKAANADLAAYSKKLQEDLATKQAEFKTKYDKYTKEAATMPDISRQSMEKDLSNLQQGLQEFQQSAEEAVQKKQMAMMNPILKKVEDAIKAVAKEGGYTYVFKKEALLYEPEDKSGDISDMVIKKLGVTPGAVKIPAVVAPKGK